MGFMFDVFPILFMIMFLLVFGMILVTFFRGIGQWNKNNNSPRLTVEATVVAKRDQVHRHHHDNHTSSSTSYFVTFQVASGDRMELQMEGRDYGMLVEGDFGDLTFQGTRFLEFVRK